MRPGTLTRISLVAAFGVAPALGILSAQQPAERQNSATAALAPAPQRVVPAVVQSGRHDVSRALRDIPPRRVREEREPHGPMRFRSFRRDARQADAAVQAAAPVTAAPAPILNFEGVNNLDAVLPPDTNGDIGPNHYVQWVNKTFAVYTRSGNLLYGPAAGSTIWDGFGGPCETQNDGDPIVLYDHLADRWLMTQFALPNNLFGLFVMAPFYQCIAVSQTPDPTGAYYRYEYEFQKLNDYPKFGVWPDGYYMAINQFASISLAFAGQGVAAFDRAAMLAGQPARMIYYDLASVDMNLGGMLPSDLDGPAPPAGSPNYFMQMDDDANGYSPDQLQVWRFQANWTTPAASTFSGPYALPVAAFDSNLCGTTRSCIPQPGTTVKLDALADRLMYRLQYRNFGTHESLVVNHSVDVDGSDHAGVRWYEVRNPGGTPVVYQQGTFAPDSFHRWMGSAAMDASGNIAIAYNVGGATLAPSIRYAARLASDPPGVLGQGENDLIIGTGSQTHTASRWGDYSMIAVDPIDGCTFWATAEYMAVTSSAGWQTRVGAFRLPGCGGETPPPPPPDPPSAVSVVASDATATEAGPTTGTFTISRSPVQTSGLTVRFSLGGTATSGADYQGVSGFVTIPGGAGSATVTITPINDTTIESDETVVLTLQPAAGYTVSPPDSAAITLTSDDRAVDLVVTGLTVPAASGAGHSIEITDATKNQGSDASTASTTTLYLSSNYSVEPTDTVLGTRSVPALTPNETNTGKTTVTIPPATAVGLWIVIAKTDGPGTIAETNEANNLRTAVIRIGPDLVVTALAAPASVAAGVPFSVTDTTANQGGGNAGASDTQFFLSGDYLLTGTDTPLQARELQTLGAGVNSPGTTNVTVPAGTAPGLYYLIAKADAGSDVDETTETNNVRYVTFRVGGDLTVSALSVPLKIAAGSTISITETTANTGASDVGASTTGFFLSTNYLLDGPDIRLPQSRGVPALLAGGTSTGTTSATVPDVAPGTWYLFAQADANATVAEANETNNVRYAVVQIGPDLTVGTLTVPTTGKAGTSITVSDTIRNIGADTAAPTVVRFYLSTNGVFDANDTPLDATRPVTALAPNAFSSGSTSVMLPAGFTGACYLIAVADGTGLVLESIETNNWTARLITIGQ